MKLAEFVVPGRSYCFLAGAGVSHDPPSNLPLARQLVFDVLNVLSLEPEVRDDLKKKFGNNDLRFEQFVQAIVAAYEDEDLEVLAQCAQSRSPNGLHYSLALAIQRGHVVLTTNFDSLIETAAKNNGLSLRCAFDRDSAASCLNEPGFYLWKLHGTLEDETGASRRASLVATMSSVGRQGEGFSLNPEFRRLLQSSLEERDLIVLGYSGSDDYDILPALARVNSTTRVLWVWHGHSDSEFAVYPYSEFARINTYATDIIGKLAEFGNWKSHQLFCASGNTATILSAISKVLFDSSPAPHIGEPYRPSPFFYREWKYHYALEPWRNDSFLGYLYRETGDYIKAHAAYVSALAKVEEIKEEASKYFVQRSLANVCLHLGKPHEAKHYLEQAGVFLEKLGALSISKIRSGYYQDVAICHTELEQVDKANEFLAKAGLEDGASTDAGLTYEKARLLYLKGERTAALPLLESTLEGRRSEGALDSVVRCLMTLATEYRRDKRYAESLAYVSEAFRTCRLLRQHSLMVDCLVIRSKTYIRMGLWGMGLRDLVHAEDVCNSVLQSPRETALICAHKAALLKRTEAIRKRVYPNEADTIHSLYIDGLGTIYSPSEMSSVKDLIDADNRVSLLPRPESTTIFTNESLKAEFENRKEPIPLILYDEFPNPGYKWTVLADEARQLARAWKCEKQEDLSLLQRQIEEIIED